MKHRFRHTIQFVLTISSIVELELILIWQVLIVISSDVPRLVSTSDNSILDDCKVGVFTHINVVNSVAKDIE